MIETDMIGIAKQALNIKERDMGDIIVLTEGLQKSQNHKNENIRPEPPPPPAPIPLKLNHPTIQQIEKGIVQYKYEVSEFANQEELAIAWRIKTNLKHLLDDIDDAVEKAGIALIKKEGIKSVDLDSEEKLILTRPKTDYFDTITIYDKLNFTKEQVEVLPKNPKFRKKVVLNNSKIANTHWIKEKDHLELVKINPKFFKK